MGLEYVVEEADFDLDSISGLQRFSLMLLNKLKGDRSSAILNMTRSEFNNGEGPYVDIDDIMENLKDANTHEEIEEITDYICENCPPCVEVISNPLYGSILSYFTQCVHLEEYKCIEEMLDNCFDVVIAHTSMVYLPMGVNTPFKIREVDHDGESPNTMEIRQWSVKIVHVVENTLTGKVDHAFAFIQYLFGELDKEGIANNTRIIGLELPPNRAEKMIRDLGEVKKSLVGILAKWFNAMDKTTIEKEEYITSLIGFVDCILEGEKMYWAAQVEENKPLLN